MARGKMYDVTLTVSGELHMRLFAESEQVAADMARELWEERFTFGDIENPIIDEIEPEEE